MLSLARGTMSVTRSPRRAATSSAASVALSGMKYGVLRTISRRASWMAAWTSESITLFSKFGPDGMTCTGMPSGWNFGGSGRAMGPLNPASSSQSCRNRMWRSRATGPRMRIHESM